MGQGLVTRRCLQPIGSLWGGVVPLVRLKGMHIFPNCWPPKNGAGFQGDTIIKLIRGTWVEHIAKNHLAESRMKASNFEELREYRRVKRMREIAHRFEQR